MAIIFNQPVVAGRRITPHPQIAGAREQPIMMEAPINAFQWAVGTSEAVRTMQQAIAARIALAIKMQGPRAIDSPRSAAIAHETGHAVVCAAFGETVRGIKIWFVEDDSFSGETEWGSGWCVDVNTPAQDDFRIACCVLAGVVGEMMLDGKNFRLASSADELVTVQEIASTLTGKLHCPYEDAFARIMRSTAATLFQNEAIAEAISKELERFELIDEERLKVLLSPIKPRAWALDLDG